MPAIMELIGARWARHVARALGIVVIGLGATAGSAQAVTKMFWGPTTGLNGQSAFPIYKQLGVDLFQTQLDWRAVAPTRPANPTDPADPAYQWPASLDQAMADAKSHGIGVALMVIRTPGWANGGRDWEWAPENPKDYADFLRAAAKRYPSVRVWMVWGEPSFNTKFQPSGAQTSFRSTRLSAAAKRGPRTYAQLLDGAYAALKAANRRNLVVGGMTAVTGDIRPENWVRNMRLPNGKAPRMDMYGHNPFSARRPNLRNRPSPQQAVDFSDLGRFQKVVDRRLAKPRGKRTLRLYLSEFTIPTAPDSEFNFRTTPATQASWIRSAFRVARQVRAYGLGWIHLYDGDLVNSGSMGGLLTADGQKKPGFTAFQRAR